MRTKVFVFLLLLFALVVDGQQKVQPTGLFPDMHYIQDVGDLVGTEIFITYRGGLQYWARFQEAGGGRMVRTGALWSPNNTNTQAGSLTSPGEYSHRLLT